MPRPLPPSESSRALLADIRAYCRRHGLAESTFGRLAVNDGKVVQRLRAGRQVTLATAERLRRFMSAPPPGRTGTGEGDTQSPEHATVRFRDNRQQYLAFVTTCDEKPRIAARVVRELPALEPRPPALRVFDAGLGEGTVLTEVLRALHQRHPAAPVVAVAKEISPDDVIAALGRLADRFQEHPATAVAITNLPWTRATTLDAGANEVAWQTVALRGTTSAAIATELAALAPPVHRLWRLTATDDGRPMPEHPAVLVLHRADHGLLLAPLLPAPGRALAGHDLVIASQPWRAATDAATRVRRVLAPLVRSLAPAGRLVAVQSCGDDAGLELVRRLWPEEDPFRVGRHELIDALRRELGDDARRFAFRALSDRQSLLRFRLQLSGMPADGRFGAATLLAAWNAATYVAQIDDRRQREALERGSWLDATEEVLRAHRGLWFDDETFTIVRRR